MIDEHYNFLSNLDEILNDENFNELEVLNDFFKSANFKINKKPVCLIREFLNDDELFFVEMQKFYDKTVLAGFNDKEICCKECKFNCSDNICTEFKKSAFFFVMFLLTQIHFMGINDRKKFVIKFFYDFNFINDEWSWDFEKTYSRILNFSMYSIDKSFSANKDTFKNVKDLNEINDELITTKSMMNNLVNEKIAPFENYVIYFEKKLISYKTKYELEKEEQANVNIISKDKEVKEFELKKIKSEIILEKLNEYGFSELPMLKDVDIKKLAMHIFNNKTYPYKVAYLYHLGFIDYLKDNYFTKGVELHKKLADIIGTTAREIGGNINVLTSRISNDNKTLYKAVIMLEKVKENYQTIL